MTKQQPITDFNAHHRKYADCKVKRLIIIETRDSYNDVAQRSYSLNCSYENMKSLEHMTHPISTNTHKVHELEIANKIPSMIQFNTALSGVAQIPYGWDTKRHRYLLEVETTSDIATQVHYVQGYTEYCDLSFSGLMDNNLKFYINSINTVYVTHDPVNNIPMIRPYNAYNIITDEANKDKNFESLSPLDGKVLETVRPYDIIRGNYLEAQYSNDGEINLVSAESIISASDFKISSKVNNNPYKYFTRTLNSFINSKINSETSYDVTDVLKGAVSETSEPDMLDNPFLLELNGTNGEYNNTFFTLNMLNKVDNSVLNSNKIIYIKNDQLGFIQRSNNILNGDNTESTVNANRITLKATSIAHIVPSIMLDSLLTEVTFSITNKTGEHLIAILNAKSLMLDEYNINLIPYIEKFKIKLEGSLCTLLNDGGFTLYQAHVDCSLLGDVSIAISLNGSPDTLYRFPLFADSLYAPVIAHKQVKDILKQDFNNAFDTTYLEHDLNLNA